MKLLTLVLAWLTVSLAQWQDHRPVAAPPPPAPAVPVQRRAASLLQGRAHRATLTAPWEPSIGDAANIGLRAEENSRVAAVAMKTARAATQAAAAVAKKNDAIIPSVMESTEGAREAASHAYQAQKLAQQTLAEVRSATMQAAHDIVAGEVFKIRHAAVMEAKKEAQGRAKKLMLKLIAEAPKAAEKAMVPWTDSWARASAIAGQYEKLGDTFVGKSNALQGKAQLELAGANSWRMLGSIAKSQGMQQNAGQMMDLALLFNGNAAKFYNAAQDIRSHEGLYFEMAKRAAYHAMVMHDPDAPPPLGTTL